MRRSRTATPFPLRRGIGTALADVDNALAAKSRLQHANLAMTTAHYVKSVDAAAIRAVDKISALFDNANSFWPSELSVGAEMNSQPRLTKASDANLASNFADYAKSMQNRNGRNPLSC